MTAIKLALQEGFQPSSSGFEDRRLMLLDHWSNNADYSFYLSLYLNVAILVGALCPHEGHGSDVSNMEPVARNQTGDLRFTKAVLFQLSYTGMSGLDGWIRTNGISLPKRVL